MIKELTVIRSRITNPSWEIDYTRTIRDNEGNLIPYDSFTQFEKISLIWATGSGKTELAKKYIIDNVDNISQAFWVSDNIDIPQEEIDFIKAHTSFHIVDINNFTNKEDFNTEMNSIVYSVYPDNDYSKEIDYWEHILYKWKKFNKKLVPKDISIKLKRKELVYVFDNIDHFNNDWGLWRLIEKAPLSKYWNIKYILLQYTKLKK